MINNLLLKTFRSIVFNTESTKKTFEDPCLKNFKCQLRKLKNEDGSEIGISIFTPRNGPSHHTFLFLHGIGANRDCFVPLLDGIDLLNQITVVTMDYRGYGDSSGEFTKLGAVDDLETTLSFMNEIFGEDFIVFAHSISAGLILEYVAKRKNKKLRFKKLVCSGAFTSFMEICANSPLFYTASFWPGFLESVKNEFELDNLKNICAVDPKKLLIIHGRNDELVPMKHARCLAKVSNANLAIIPGDHGTVVCTDLFWKKIFDFIQERRKISD